MDENEGIELTNKMTEKSRLFFEAISKKLSTSLVQK